MGLYANRVFLDSNVLFSRTQRDWFGLLTSAEEMAAPFRVYWTEDLLSEALYHLRRKNPKWDGATLTRIGDNIRQTWPDGRVAQFEVDGSFAGSDPNDGHVHAATLACKAHYLVTNNINDFDGEHSDELPYEIVTPDDFLVLVDDVAPRLVADGVNRQLDYWGARQDIVQALQRANCTQFAQRVLLHLQRRALRG